MQNQPLDITDEWPPATAEEGGVGASLAPTTRADANYQGRLIQDMWARADPSDRRVRVNPREFHDPRVSHLLNYCECYNKIGVDLDNCCNNNGLEFQKDPTRKGSHEKAVFFKESLQNAIHHISPSKRDETLWGQNSTGAVKERRAETLVS